MEVPTPKFPRRASRAGMLQRGLAQLKSVPRVSSGLGQVNFLSCARGELCIRECPGGGSGALLCIRNRIHLTRPGLTRCENGHAASQGRPLGISRFCPQRSAFLLQGEIAQLKSVPRVSSGLGEVNSHGCAGGELCIRECL